MSDEMLDGGAVNEIAQLAVSASMAVEEIEHGDETVKVLITKQGDNTCAEGVKKFFDEWRERPERREGVAICGNVDSFIDMTNRHKDSASAIFASVHRDGTSASLTAVIDYDSSKSEPGNQRHRILHPFPFSREWLALCKMNDEAMPQLDFAEWVEDNIHLIAVADGDELEAEKTFQAAFATPSDILTLSRGLKINVESKVKEIHNLKSGEAQIEFEMTHKGAGGEPLHVPGLIMFKAPIFDGGPVNRFVARLRYRASGGAIVWRYVLYRPVDAIRAAVEAEADRAQEATELPLFWAAPERASDGRVQR